jgi:hypothetical protein
MDFTSYKSNIQANLHSVPHQLEACSTPLRIPQAQDSNSGRKTGHLKVLRGILQASFDKEGEV